MKGSALPRIYTPPLPDRREGKGCVPGCSCGLTPATSRGFEVVRWANSIGIRLFPWQRWLLVHALELDATATRYRFRTDLVLVARQNGKTMVKMVLTLYRMYVQRARLCVGTAQDLSQAREVMNEGLVPMMLSNPALRARFDPDSEDSAARVGIWHKVWSDEYFRLDTRWHGNRPTWSEDTPRYVIKALNEKAGRGLWDVAEVNIDEGRTQYSFDGWGSVSKVVMAAPDAQIWVMSNAGEQRSVLLNHLRGVAIGGADEQMFLAEWSAPLGCALDDVEAWQAANPSLGHPGGITEQAIRSALATDPPGIFRTEVLCQFVGTLNHAIDGDAWKACADAVGGHDDTRPVICVEAAAEGDGVAAYGAWPMSDGRVRVEPIASWGSTTEARAGLGLVRDTWHPRAMGWFPRGPGATLSSTMRKLKISGAKDGKAAEIKGTAMSEACMTFANMVDERRITHADDPMLNTHVEYTSTVGPAQSWTFDRGPGETYALWAAAGAVHLLLNAPPPRRRSGRSILVPDA